MSLNNALPNATTTITDEESDATLKEVLRILREEGRNPIKNRKITITPTKEFVTAIVCYDDHDLSALTAMSNMVYAVFVEASLTFHSDFLRRKIDIKFYTENIFTVVMMRASKSYTINLLLAIRINNKLNYLISSPDEKQVKKYCKRVKEIAKGKTIKQCAFCCKKGEPRNAHV
jgi:hypothetical protein